MNQLNDRDYYARRAATARNLAQRAADPAIAAIHAELAHRYDLLVAQPEAKNDSPSSAAQAT